MNDNLAQILDPSSQQPESYQPNQPSPPADEADFAARVSGWSQVLQTLRQNPNVGQALMFMGSRILAGRRPGQTTGSTIAEGALGGMQMYGALEQNAQELQQKAQQDALNAQVKQAEIESRKATTAKTTQDMRLEAEREPVKRRETEALAKWREAEARKTAAEAAGLEAVDPVQMAKLKIEAAQAEIFARRMSGAASGAHAALYGEQRRWVEPEALADISSKQALTAERLSSTAKNFGAGGTAAGGDKTALGYQKLNLEEKKAVNKAFTDAKGDGIIPRNWTILDFYTNVWNAVPTGGEAAPASKPRINPNTNNEIRRFKFD